MGAADADLDLQTRRQLEDQRALALIAEQRHQAQLASCLQFWREHGRPALQALEAETQEAPPCN